MKICIEAGDGWGFASGMPEPEPEGLGLISTLRLMSV